MGQRMVGRPDQPVPPVLRRLRILPIATPIALSAAAVLGDDVVAFVPIYPDLAHMGASLLTGAVLAGGVFGVSHLLQRRLYGEAQALMAGGLR